MVSASKEEEAKGKMKWERFMPRMVVRVLLVEADDSTRQVIAALLRKCNCIGLASSPAILLLSFLVDAVHWLDNMEMGSKSSTELNHTWCHVKL